MKTMLGFSRLKRPGICSWMAIGLLVATCFVARTLGAQSVAPRISSEIVNSSQTTLKGSLHPLAQPQFDAGRLPADTRLNGMSIVFNRTPAQQADLDSLIAAQQTKGSPYYHQWLTPDQFAARFGMAPSDIEKVEGWLQQQGFSIGSVARSRNMIRFSGTAQQVESAFSTQMHSYKINGERHFAPSSELALPSSLALTVQAVRNLDDFRPKSHLVSSKSARPRPSFTGAGNSSLFFAPGDISTVYDIHPAYSAGFNGAGQSIAIVGQSAIVLSDIENFQKASGLTVKDPILVPVPNTGSATSVSTGDESESDLDLEWSGAIAPGATINFVYVGSDQNVGAFDALEYAIDEKIAPIISSSYGTCEANLGNQTLESIFQQAVAQGQTLIAAAGDDGSTDCFVGTTGQGNPPLSQQEALAVDYPGSSVYVTGMGGTEISQANSAYLTAGSAYWESASGSTDQVSSALQYIPEVVWNEDQANCGFSDCLASGGGGASSLFTKPAWQTGVAGIPADGKRDVPDIALNSSTSLPGYLFCSSDNGSGSFWQQGQQSSCTSGFEDSASGALTAAGGTSFAAPIFSGMVAILNQMGNYTTGQGLINPTLYSLASNGTTYASAFHDITTGNNDCTAGSAYCSGPIGFSAGAGYDQATGLGTIDFYNLATAWPANTGTGGGGSVLVGTTTAVTASTTTPAVNATDTFTITVASATGTTVPTGDVTIVVDGGTPITGNALSANGTFTYSTAFATVGAHTVVAQYLGDGLHAASTGTIAVNVPTPVSGTGTFALAATGITVAQGSQGSSTITVTPAGGYTGTVDLSFDTSNDNALQNLCYEFTNMASNGDGTVAVSGTAAVTTQLTLDANASDCAGTGAVRAGMRRLSALHRTTARNGGTNGANPAPAAIAFAGLLLAGFLGRSARKFRGLAALIALAALGLGLSACGSSINNTLSNPSKGTYTITVTGQDATSASIPTATTTFQLVIQ